MMSGASVWMTPNGARGFGIEQDPNDPTRFSTTFTYTASSGTTHTHEWVCAGEFTHDVNQDGRFNSADINELTGYIGTNNQTIIDKYDWNDNHAIDADDVGYFNRGIEAGLSSGIFGDANSDGTLDCCDRNAAPSNWSITIMDANYNINLDYDLDGDLDSTDLAEFVSLQLPVDIDFNNDNSVFDPQDIDAILSVFSEGPCIPSSATCDDIDINGDGTFFDPADVDLFMDAIAENEDGHC